METSIVSCKTGSADYMHYTNSRIQRLFFRYHTGTLEEFIIKARSDVLVTLVLY